MAQLKRRTAQFPGRETIGRTDQREGMRRCRAASDGLGWPIAALPSPGEPRTRYSELALPDQGNRARNQPSDVVFCKAAAGWHCAGVGMVGPDSGPRAGPRGDRIGPYRTVRLTPDRGALIARNRDPPVTSEAAETHSTAGLGSHESTGPSPSSD
eukprot:758458-Hanusia_phi.AAC.1